MKRILFVIDSLRIGGAEKSLVTLLNLFDYSIYQVDLLLFARGGEFESLLPQEVHLLDVPDFFAYTHIPWKKIGKKVRRPLDMIAQLRYSFLLRTTKNDVTEQAILLWKSYEKRIAEMPVEYDVAIAYAQGGPTFYVAEKVNAKKKIAWINATYIPEGKYLDYIKPVYAKFDFVNGVSATIVELMQKVFGIPDNKSMQMTDILDVEFAHRMAKMKSTAEKEMDGEGVKILTVGRFGAMKRYDLAIEAAKILVDKGVKFTWYVVGDGSMREDIEKQIAVNKLQKRFILLGCKSNPYPFFAACDLYVQTSDYEGFGITLAEAKMFQKPIVTTNFPAVGAQFVNEKNGLIVDISAKAIADGIIRMLTDPQLRDTCVENVSKEKIGNPEEVEKFYRMVEV